MLNTRKRGGLLHVAKTNIRTIYIFLLDVCYEI